MDIIAKIIATAPCQVKHRSAKTVIGCRPCSKWLQQVARALGAGR